MQTITHHERTVENIIQYIGRHFKDKPRYKTIVEAYAEHFSSEFDSVFEYVCKELLRQPSEDASAFRRAFGEAADEPTSDSTTSIKDGNTGNQAAADTGLSLGDRWSKSSHSTVDLATLKNTTWYLQDLPGTMQLKEEPRSLVTQGSTEEPEPKSRWSSSTDSQGPDEQR
jgi:hypothetical protein